MAAPSSKTARTLSGRWRLSQPLSAPLDAFLALQGVGWAARKAAPLVTVTLSLREYVKPAATESVAVVSNDHGVPYVRVEQTATLGWHLASEDRRMDWAWQQREDPVFGPLRCRARYLDTGNENAAVSGGGGGSSEDEGGAARTDLDDEEQSRYLYSEWVEPGLVEVVQTSEVKHWHSVQVWGFERIAGERRLCIKGTVVDSRGKRERMRLVYDFVGERAGAA